MITGGLKHKIQDMIDNGTVGPFPKLIQLTISSDPKAIAKLVLIIRENNISKVKF